MATSSDRSESSDEEMIGSGRTWILNAEVESVREEDAEREEEDDDDMDEDEAPNNQTSNAGVHEGNSSTSASREGSNIVITLTDPGLLDCPICFEPLTVPVFQCDQNGHIACSLCCTKINNKCPSCSGPIRSNRCRAIEKVLESSRTPCQNIKYGCNTPVTYNKKNEHEKACVFSPCACPYVGCNFVSSTNELYRHFSNGHLDSATGFLYDNVELDFSFPVTLNKSDSFLVVREKHRGTLFILHNSIEVLGNVVTVSCIKPSCLMEDFNYYLSVTNKESSLTFWSVTKSTPSLQVNGSPSRSFLLIPCEFFNSCGQVKIDVSIYKGV
ncbi:putative aminoacyltransferase, E1 ubiquitin-activating enzyme [Rosa chinensis]|uniref:RING-type E3 ubiquitin transferase n=1 Tax=Rosa chinensis TaxID=74649 RepID=A0A2P6RQ08_ROSCH|nr:E3 ubiquitin-protein ligase SINA-like 7 [Rosa chinensis]PRQ48526.1 putative aminoacyltransferase, E1 ubiquitin-activating enzyme [Rosa chinensis]